jgi:hypothetical protein
LIDLHARIRAYGPAGMEQTRVLLPDGISGPQSQYDAAEGANSARRSP